MDTVSKWRAGDAQPRSHPWAGDGRFRTNLRNDVQYQDLLALERTLIENGAIEGDSNLLHELGQRRTTCPPSD